MEIKILQVFLGVDGLPYKDKARSVHYPIIGNGFQGANNTTQIKFYFGEIGDSNTTWVAVSKLPNGRIGSKVLETYEDAEIGEPYALLQLDSFYTQYRGDVFISLQGYEGGVNVEYNSETELYEIHGTPTIQATGSIKFSNNYATQFVGSGEEENADLQSLMALLGLKANASETYTRYASAFASVTLQTLYEKFGYDAFLLNNGTSDYLMQFQVSSGNVYAIRMVDLTTLKTWYALIGSGTNQLPLSSYVSALYIDTYLQNITSQEYVAQYYVPYTGADNNVDLGGNHITAMYFNSYSDANNYAVYTRQYIRIRKAGGSPNYLYFPNLTQTETIATQSYVSDSYVPYSGATKDVDLGNAWLKASGLQIGDIYHTLDIVSNNLIIGTGVGDIDMQPYGKLLYNSNEVATYTQLVNAQTTLQTNIDASGHKLVISGGIDTDFEYTISLKDKNNNTISSDTFDLPLESVVISGAYDSVNQEIVLTLEDGSTIEIPVGDLVSGLVSQSDFDTLSNTVTSNYNNSVKYIDINVSGGYINQISKSGVAYPIAQSVDVTTIPKVVQSTTDLPADNDGYLYLVLDNGYLYYYETGTGWVQGYEYVQDVSNFVQTSRTIAGIYLANDISAQSLTDALVFMNNTTDLDYVMED